MVQRRKRLLDTDAILDAALACVDATGRLTMAELATRLGVSASSIYHHFSGRTAIVEALRERMATAIDPPPLDESDWGEQIGRWMRGYRRVLAEHPALIPLLNEQTMTAGPVLHAYESIAVLLRRTGVPVREIVLWIGALDCYALGAALDLAAPDEVWRLERDDLPTLGAAIGAAPRGRDRADEAFDLGLDALLTGLRVRLAAR
ncbi:TetR family transcriptional regulator [Amycolatopsis vastitatis]|uniref:TetR family transcriptional regulator n=1 Tax=Amycolatopsis vastitatis TaxID=1905142 RepID=A0A229T3U2_9PSEU|nr:TetR family transcriptional regulator [Amycolatopsis vastitatis]